MEGRRKVLQNTLLLGIATCFPTTGLAAETTALLRLESPEDKANLILYDVIIGSPPKTVVAIKQVLANNKNKNLQPGLVLKNYPNARAVVDRIRRGPYPIDFEFYNLDASNGELGEALTAQDALFLAQKSAAADAESQASATMESSSITTASTVDQTYVKRVVNEVPADDCRIRSRRDDVLEIIYDAHITSMDGIMYDSSATRGTGRPYQMVLGSGDMIPGVDQGLYGMCPGEVRQLEIPPYLAYGAKGSKLFRIPGNTRLVWTVELVSVNSMRQPQEE